MIADVHGRLVEMQRHLDIQLEDDQAAHLAGWYGTEAPGVLQYCAQTGLLDRLGARSPILSGEIGYSVRHAGAVRLGDAVLRRTPAGSAGHPGADVLTRAAAVMAKELGWSGDRTAEEVRDVERRYQVP
jgi:glycerol-3-phosphate dehydrogenase